MSENQEQEKLQSLKELKDVLEETPERLAEMLEYVHAADIALWMQDLPNDVSRHVFQLLDAEARAEVLEYAEAPLVQELIKELNTGELTEIVEELPSDEVVDLLAHVDEKTSEEVLAKVEAERAEELRELKSYPPDTAGGQMTSEYVAVARGSRVGDVIKEIKLEGEEAEEGVGAFVLDDQGRPVGYLTDRLLLTNSIHTEVDEVMVEPFTIEADEDQEEAANLIHKYALEALAVVDGDGRIIGILDSDDAADVLDEEVAEDIHKIVGASAEQQTRLPILTRVRHRLPLQGLTVVGGLVTALILDIALGNDEPEYGSSPMDLLRFIPIVIGLAGNVGIQASTILVRAFATGEVERDRERSVLASEVVVGLTIGVLCGLTTVPVAAWMEGDLIGELVFGASVGLAIACAVTWAAFLGCVVPMGCRRAGIDPAIVAGPFLITLSDISGTSIFVLVAHLMIG